MNAATKEALIAAKDALEDLGACDDPNCNQCNRALTKVREVLNENEIKETK